MYAYTCTVKQQQSRVGDVIRDLSSWGDVRISILSQSTE